MGETPHKKSRVISQTQRAFNVWGIVLAIWAVYRATIGAESPLYFDELILKPLLFIGPVLLYVTRFERRNLSQGLWLSLDDLPAQLRTGLLLSLPIIGLWIVLSVMSRTSWSTSLMVVPIALGMAFSEEVLSRGFVARHILEESHSIIRTIIQAGIMHMFLRIPRIMTTPELIGERLVIFVIGDLALSLILTAVFLWRRSLVPVIVARTVATMLLMTALT